MSLWFFITFSLFSKGYGVFAKRTFNPGEFLLEYPAERISYEDAEKREQEYEASDKGCFIFFLEENRKLIG